MKRHVAIIGGGYTGMTAALRLSQQGYKVSLYERTPYLGGLASGFTIEGEHLEKAYHHLFRTDTSIISLAKELGIEEKLLWRDSSVALYYDKQVYPFMTPLDLIKFKPLTLINRIRAGIVVLYLQKTKRWERFQSITAYKWMKKYAGKQVTEVIWEPLLKGKFFSYYDKVSMAWLWARVHIRANSRVKGDSGEKLGYFDGGFDVFTKALEKALIKNDVSIYTETQISRLGGGSRPKIHFVGGRTKQFDAIIATVPSEVFANLAQWDLPEEETQRLRSINYIGAILHIFSSDQELSPYYWHNINDPDLPFLVFINHTRLMPKEHYGNKFVYYIGAYIPHDHRYFSVNEKTIPKEWHKGLKQIFPEFDPKKINESYVFRFKNAQHVVGVDYAQKKPSYKTPLTNVYLANFSQIYPEDRGTNYAVRDGDKVAKLVLGSLGP